ncbi:hypothetical protein BBP00_00007624 [Phytophthora kernoviae]|uniref:Glutathione peroxidase n=1 Tax=Phytophthora kernoviae TaxID=325452 RepID=A0A3F2RHN6_9STRA|nr:hypothetical protein BBP00_00007624 [Phytophthora kernoviae]
MTEQLQGRVFARKAAFPNLPEELQKQTLEAQTLLTEKKADVFTVHHSALVKVPQSARGKELVDYLEKWLTPEPEKTEEAAAEPEKKAEEATEEVEAIKTEEDASKKEVEAPEEDAEAPKEDAEAPKEETEAVKAEEAPKEKKKEEKKKEKKKVEEPSPYRLRAKEIAEALVVSGFLTPYKDRVKNFLAEAPKEYITDNELFVPIPEAVTESKETTVWNVVDGAIYASQLKRKAGVFSAFTQGKDVYVVANEKTSKVHLFESDVARTAVAEYAAADAIVQYDNAHFKFGVKLVHGERFELLNLETKESQEAFLNTLLNVGVQYREVYNLAAEEAKSFYELKDFDMEKKEVGMETYKGKVVLVVNVSSKCGLTPTNYPELQQLYEKYKDEGLEILAFPCNQFAGQEPGTNEEIIEFVKQYNVTFPLFEKNDVNGSDARPVFTYLKAKLPGTFGNYIKWNFTKFLVDRNGQPFKRYAPKDLPLSFEDDIKELLAKAADPEPTEEEAKEEAEAAKSDGEEPKETKEEVVTETKEVAPTTEEVATKEEPVTTEEHMHWWQLGFHLAKAMTDVGPCVQGRRLLKAILGYLLLSHAGNNTLRDAQQLAESLVLSGFLSSVNETPEDDDTLGELYVQESCYYELVAPGATATALTPSAVLSATVGSSATGSVPGVIILSVPTQQSPTNPSSQSMRSESKLSVWSVTDGATRAAFVQRRVGRSHVRRLLGIPPKVRVCYAVVNQTNHHALVIFETDVARQELVRVALPSATVEYHSTTVDGDVSCHDLKICGDEDTVEVLGFSSKSEQEQWLLALLGAGGTYLETHCSILSFAVPSASLYSMYDTDATGSHFCLSTLRGQVLVLVNVPNSTCSDSDDTRQISELVELSTQYADAGFRVVAFPSAQFRDAEFDNDEKLATHLQQTFEVIFPVLATRDVNGPNARDALLFLKSRLTGATSSSANSFIEGDFVKFLVDREGRPVKRYNPSFMPRSMEGEIQQLL